jgi:hypothetical protein
MAEAKPRKKTFKEGMKLFHNETKEQIMFGKWGEPDIASCLKLKTKEFLKIPREDLETNYTSYASLDKAYREKRRGQGW